MAQRPDGKAAGTERVVFTRPAADRIAKVVRKVESGNRGGAPLVFDRVAAQSGSPLRLATFTGSWNTGAWKQVTLAGSTHTAHVYNWCNAFSSNEDPCCPQAVIFGNAGGTNSVVELAVYSTCATCHINIGGLDLTTLPNYSGQAIQLLGHDSSACLRWYSVTSCSTTAS